MRSDPTFNGNDLKSLVRVTEEAVNEVRAMLNPQAPVDETKIRKEEREKTTSELMKKFNITKPKVNTLGSIRNADPDINDKFEAIQAKTGIEYEEVMRELTPRERELFAERLEAGV
jgi:phage-related minor tail protein